MDILRIFIISESEYRIYNLFIEEKYVMLGCVLCMKLGICIFDFGSGLGEMFCIWVRDYGIMGIGIDMSSFFIVQVKCCVEEFGVSECVYFIYNDAVGYVVNEKCDVVVCVGVIWIVGGFVGVEELLV